MSSKGRILSPKNVVSGLLERLVWLTFPRGQRAEPEGVIVTHVERVPVLAIWGSWEETIRPKGSKSKLTVPSITAIWDDFRSRFPEAEAATNRFHELMSHPGETDLTLDASLAQFEFLEEAQQEEALALARTIYSFEAARTIIRGEQIAALQVAVQTGRLDRLAAARKIGPLEADMKKQQKALGVAPRFIGTVQWERAAIHITREVLPEGPWPRQELVPELPAEPVLPPGAVLEIGDVLIVEANDPRIDPDRDPFYTQPVDQGGLCCQRRVALGHFGRKGYILYIYRAASGRLYAILDCPLRGNAGLIFLIGMPGPEEEPTAWHDDAAQSKHELLEARREGRGTCLKAFYHSKLWKENLRKYLTRLP